MFVHPATHHFGRTYSGSNPSGHPTTSRKNINKENALALQAKTPSRPGKALVPSTSIRLGLGVKSVARDGNVMQKSDASGHAHGKGKGKEDNDSKKLSASVGPSKPMLSTSKSFGSLQPTQKQTKTPAPRRQATMNLRTPAPPMAPVMPTPLPSATRTRRRSRQSLTPIRPGDKFKTPAPSGGRWDEEISFGSIHADLDQMALGEVAELDEDTGDGEIEYMPPPVQELPWEPAFQVLDLQTIFGNLSKVPPMWAPYQDAPRKLADPVIEAEPEVRPSLCDDDMLEEPLFRKPQPRLAEKTVAVACQVKPVARARVTPAPTTRPGITRAPTAPVAKRPVPQTSRSSTMTLSASARSTIRSDSSSARPGLQASRPGIRLTAPAPKPLASIISIPAPTINFDDEPLIDNVEFTLDLGFDSSPATSA